MIIRNKRFNSRTIGLLYFILSTICIWYLIATNIQCGNGSVNYPPQEISILLKKNAYLLKRLHLEENELNHNIFNEKNGSSFKFDSKIPVIYVITPTYARHVQKAELIRLSHTFMHVISLHWIVIEDSIEKTNLIAKLLKETALKYTHLYVKTPEKLKLKDDEPPWLKHKGVLQRNEGLDWIRKNVDKNSHGVVYFADDDNTYALKVFEEMRFTKTVSVWPVGLVGKLKYEAPLVEKGQVSGWRTYWKPERKFASDMAGFAINLNLIFENPVATFNVFSRRGELESNLIKDLRINLSDLEPKANNCSEILVWHTRTEMPDLKNEYRLNEQVKNTKLHLEI